MTHTATEHSSDTPSLAEELERLLPDLRGFAWSLCRDKALADDLVQDACMKAWSTSDSLKPGLSIKPWVFKILRNEWRQLQRRAWRTKLVDAEEIEQSLVGQSNAAALADSVKATNAIYNLPELHRDAVILVLAAGMTYAEAAQVLGCSIGTVKSRLSRARQALIVDLDHGSAKPRAPLSLNPSESTGLDRLMEHADMLVVASQRAA